MIELNPNYWDCECKDDYIHPKSQSICILCDTEPNDQPDSRESEIEKEQGERILFSISESEVRDEIKKLLDGKDLDSLSIIDEIEEMINEELYPKVKEIISSALESNPDNQI